MGIEITEEKSPRELAREFMLGEVMAAAMKQLRALTTPSLINRKPSHV